MNRICITGSGVMREGVAHVFAEKGFEVTMWNSDMKVTHEETARSLEQQISKYNMSLAECQAILSRITLTTDIKFACDCNLVIDVSNENMNLKKNRFRKLDQICSSDTIFTSNTSAFLMNELAGTTKRQDKFVGLHFFKPVTVMKHVEVLRGKETSDQALSDVMNTIRKTGKNPVEVAEVPGFMISRLPVPTIRETEVIW